MDFIALALPRLGAPGLSIHSPLAVDGYRGRSPMRSPAQHPLGWSLPLVTGRHRLLPETTRGVESVDVNGRVPSAVNRDHGADIYPAPPAEQEVSGSETESVADQFPARMNDDLDPSIWIAGRASAMPPTEGARARTQPKLLGRHRRGERYLNIAAVALPVKCSHRLLTSAITFDRNVEMFRILSFVTSISTRRHRTTRTPQRRLAKCSKSSMHLATHQALPPQPSDARALRF